MFRIVSYLALVAALVSLSCGGVPPEEEEISKLESAEVDFQRIWPLRCGDNCQLDLRLPQEIKSAVPIIPLSGNVETKRFHKPSCPHYRCIQCTASFKSVREAMAAGFRPHSCFE